MDWEKDFYEFLMEIICKQNSIRLQMASNDIVNAMQKLPPKHPVNMHRKQYGNLQQCFKAKKNPFFSYTDNLVVLLPKDKMDQLNQHGLVPLYQLYVQTYDNVQKKLIEIMKINKENQCQVCGVIRDVWRRRRSEGSCSNALIQYIMNNNKLIIFGEQSEKNKKKLQQFLITHDIQINKDTLEAVVKIKMEKNDNEYLKQIQNKIQYYQKQLASLQQFKGINYELKQKQKEKYQSQIDELHNIEEICQRSDKFSEQLKSLFYVCLHYHYLQNIFVSQEIKLEEILEIFKMVFFNLQTTTNKDQKVLQFCVQHYKSLQKIKEQSTHSKNLSIDTKSQTSGYSRGGVENKTPSRSTTPKRQQICNKSIVELSTPQLKNYYTQMLKKININNQTPSIDKIPSIQKEKDKTNFRV
ncbi:unnamed protein product [Paramecium primaurelia]|uniref:Uncharacterized protein n=1 Tax=Paramecium primaurelia TaxID=5886 RepID=A0A8S1QEY6_PARPR|nr:unnamed protein product [Paramecium primaurelia]